MPPKQLTCWDAGGWFILVLVVCIFARAFLIDYVRPVLESDSSKSALELLAVILGILAAGCTAAFFSYTYKDAEEKERVSVRIMSWSLIIAFALLVFLCMYCLQKIGVFNHMDIWARYVLFFAAFFMLYGLVLLEIWDATLLGRKKSNNSKDK